MSARLPQRAVSGRATGRAPTAGHGEADRRMEQVMGRLLQVGVTLASATVLAGGVLYLRLHQGEVVDYSRFGGGEGASLVPLVSPGAVLERAGHADAAALILLGVLLLIATPVARVVFAVLAFAAERDRLYVAISLAVLAVLLAGLLHGR